jgi:hypothetical protein
MITTVQGFTLSAINAAIAQAVNSGNRIVYFPPDTQQEPPRKYTINDEIVLDPAQGRSNLTFMGVPGKSIIRQTAQNKNIFVLEADISHVTFRGLSFEGTGQPASTWDTGAAIFGHQVSDITVEDCRVTNMGGAGIAFDQDDRDGEVLRRIVVRRCRLEGNQMLAAEQGYVDVIVYGACEDVAIEANECLSANDSGIQVYYGYGSNDVPGGEPKPITNVHIAENRCEGHARHGIVGAYGRTIPDGLSIVNNVCRNNGWIGVYVNATLYPEPQGDPPATANFVEQGRTVISGNYCSGNGWSDYGHGSLRGGIFAVGYDLVVSGNVSYENVTYEDAEEPEGVGIRAAGVRLVVADNVCRDNQGHGIVVWGAGKPYLQAADQITVSGNRCRDNARRGIYVSGADMPSGETAPPAFPTSGVVVSGNACEGNDEEGIFLDRVQGVEVTGNTCRDNDLTGIRLFSYDRRTAVTHNVCLDNCRTDAWPYAGIHLDDHYSTSVPSKEGLVSGNTSSRTSGVASFQQYGIQVNGYRPVVIGNVVLGYTGVTGGAGINNLSGGTAVLMNNVFDEEAPGPSSPGHSVVVVPNPP